MFIGEMKDKKLFSALYHLLPAYLALFIIIIFSSSYISSDWWKETIVDNNYDSGIQCSLAIDHNLEPHISYYDVSTKSIVYASKTSDKWNNMRLKIGSRATISIDSNNQPHIVYFQGTLLKHTWYNGVKWLSENIHSNCNTSNASIYYDKNIPYICLFDRNDKTLKIASKILDYWAFDTVITNIKINPLFSHTLDPQGNLHIVYYSRIDNSVYYYYKEDDKWHSECVISNVYNPVSLSLSIYKTNHPYIIYNTNNQLMLAEKIGINWIIIPVSLHASGPAHIAIDSKDQPHILYLSSFANAVASDLILATRYNIEIDKYNTYWQFEQVITKDLGKWSHLSLKLDKEDNDHICYYSTNQKLKYLFRDYHIDLLPPSYE